MRIRYLLFVLILLILPLGIQAQEDEDEPLFQVLSVIPDGDISRLPIGGEPLIWSPWVWFGDFQAAFEADPEIDPPADYADYLSIFESATQGLQRNGQSWRISVDFDMPGVNEGIGPERDPVTFGFGGPKVGEVFPELNGLEYFDLHFAGSFGRPPQRGLIYGGDFDLDSVGDAHTARGYQEYDIEGVRAWCSTELSCEDQNNRGEMIEPFNLFDPRLSTQPPFLGADGLLIGSRAHNALDDVAATINGESSLLDAADFRTLAEAITDSERYSGDLVQAYFMPLAAAFNAIDMTTMEPTDDFSLIIGDLGVLLEEESLFISEWANYGELPLYELITIADRAEGDDVVTLLALYYRDEADAEMAATEIAGRLETYTAALTFEGLEPILQDRPGNVEFLEPYVYASEETGHFAAVVPMRNDLQFTDPEGLSDVYNQNVIYPFLISEILNAGFYPLWDIRVADWFIEMAEG